MSTTPFLPLPPHLSSSSSSSSPSSSARMASRVPPARASPLTVSPPRGGEEEAAAAAEAEGEVSLGEWQRWGTSSPVPSLVAKVVRDLKALEMEVGAPMRFGGLGGKLQGDFRVQEDKKHRALYQSMVDSEEKLRYFSARQIACRLLGSRRHLCQKCWLAMEDCMCPELVPCSLWQGIRFWLYMHPKDFLRQNNTGKLLWQVFGVESASLCLFGIHEQEEIMWDAFKHAGKGNVWFLYPNKHAPTRSLQEIFFHGSLTKTKNLESLELDHKTLNFVLIDGTWSNSAAMFSRLKEHTKLLWGEDDVPCVSLTTLGASAMHKLRPQPSWDRTCTAAAAAGLLSELHLCPDFVNYGLDKQANAVENALDVLLDALVGRRRHMGRPSTRGERNNLC